MEQDKIPSFEELEKLSTDELTNIFYTNPSALHEKLSSVEFKAVLYRIHSEIIYLPESEIKDDIKKIGKTERDMNQTWKILHESIKQEIVNSIVDYNTIPTDANIGVNMKTDYSIIKKHLLNYEKTEYPELEKQKLKLGTERLITYLLSKALRGDMKAANLYLKYAEQNVFDKPTKVVTPVTNQFIKVDNIYINQSTIMNLPPDKKQAIQDIILSENLNYKMIE